ncbi:MipA/OmpV family protein [Paracoccus sp. (in: a-proteobacteria)]|uniref:MipA/OmpV family protein n=1 Tax=Paracoccus sp. TaxID=267 RepID=UPI0026DF7190|nr:MipA/OmpV family protein [Paracoccus sp. (in: a-proteobacteria)]MDO5646340.1 MipA/OmpV family protein [Paracoccus sp. (in: a-proteobacteria)]
MKYASFALMLMATPVAAQNFGGASFDVGLGAAYQPAYPGASSDKVTPWFIFRDGSYTPGAGQDAQGFGIAPSAALVGKRKSSDSDKLAGLPNVDRAIELGARARYGMGPVTGYATVRRGFNGHTGFTGEVGARVRTDVTDRFTLWSGAEVTYGNARYNRTYFGISDADAAAAGRDAYDAGSGFNAAALTLDMRYAVTDTTALVGEMRYGRLIGDAKNSPVVQDTDQSSIKIGVVQRFSFGF